MRATCKRFKLNPCISFFTTIGLYPIAFMISQAPVTQSLQNSKELGLVRLWALDRVDLFLS